MLGCRCAKNIRNSVETFGVTTLFTMRGTDLLLREIN